MTDCSKHSGADILMDPHRNHGVAFSQKERAELGLRGLLPPVPSSPEQQVERMHEMLSRLERPIDKALFLDSLHAHD